jgi:hypothetical protein
MVVLHATVNVSPYGKILTETLKTVNVHVLQSTAYVIYYNTSVRGMVHNTWESVEVKR